jgi:hypothetical protein
MTLRKVSINWIWSTAKDLVSIGPGFALTFFKRRNAYVSPRLTSWFEASFAHFVYFATIAHKSPAAIDLTNFISLGASSESGELFRGRPG